MIEEWATIERYNDAVVGSRRLRDAVLFAKGIVPPDEPPPATIKLVTKPPKPKPPRAIKRPAISVCPTCGTPHTPGQMQIANIQATVASYYGIERWTMTSAQRSRDFAHPRQVAMYLASKLTGKSLPAIGRTFKRDHTTVLHAIRAVEKRITEDDEVATDVAVLREELAA